LDRDRVLQVNPDGAEARPLLAIHGGVSGALVRSDGEALLYQSRSSLYSFSLKEGYFEELLRIETAAREDASPQAIKKKEEAERKREGEGLEGFHRAEQRGLFRTIYEKHTRREADRLAKANEARSGIGAYFPPKGFRLERMIPSPSGTQAVAVLTSDKSEGRVAEMPDYVTEDGYAAMRKTRAKVGDKTRRRRMELVTFGTDPEVTSIGLPESKRVLDPSSAHWSPDGQTLLVKVLSDDDQQVWLLRVDPTSGQAETLHSVEDSAWVLGSQLSPQFLPDSSGVLFLSEADGFLHIYHHDLPSGMERQVTQGRFEVSEFVLLRSGDALLAIATPTSPFHRDLVRIELESGKMELLPIPGSCHSMTLAPDENSAAVVTSAANVPPELHIVPLSHASFAVQVTDSPSIAWKSLSWMAPPIVFMSGSDGAQIPARVYRPAPGEKNGGAVVFVHGAGYLQNVHNWWSRYSREYGYHHWLVSRGFTVLDLDYRGSAGYGRDVRTAIYGHMGGRDLEDCVDAAAWLVQHEGVAKERIGIYGGSYGGFITLMALFTKPGVFASGAALRPVTDWAHYNDGYTSNILDDPTESPLHYERSSPIHFAQGLSVPLLICHGLLDDNVHVQDVFRLQQRLIELRKRDFEVATYPMEAHGFTDAASWSDEYWRIDRLFERTLLPQR
jgi:dipeptidyl aminopeptidase/acylaminoacyl peptidase